MSQSESSSDRRYAMTVSLLKAHPTLKLPSAMYLARFTEEECKDRSIQMRVRRLIPPSAVTTHSSSDETMTPKTIESSVSSLTADTSSPSELTNSLHGKALFPAPKPSQERKTATAKQQQRAGKATIKNHKKRAHKRATSWYAKEKEKENGLAAETISKKVKEEFDGHGPSARTIQRYVNDLGIAGNSPLKRGPNGNIPAWAYSSLCTAFESFVRIQQINAGGHENTRKILSRKLNILVGNESKNNKLYYRVLKDTAIDMNTAKHNNCEDRRIQWTTYKNLRMWFDNWGKDLVDLGFAHQDDEGNIIIATSQLSRILNFDETCLSHDGSQGSRGGRPEVYLFDPHLFLNLERGCRRHHQRQQ